MRLLGQSTKTHFLETRFLIVVGFSTLGIGILGGFYLYAFLQNQAQILIPATVILVFLTWLGSGADFLGFLKEWYKDRKDEERRTRSQPKFIIIHKEGNLAQFVRMRKFERPGIGLVDTKVLTIGIHNDSEGIAENCTAGFKIDIQDKSKFPTDERKFLRWARYDTEEMQIGAHKTEYLNVVFCSKTKFHNMNTFIAERDSINEGNIPRDIDGFELGKYTFTISIEPDLGQKKEAKFRIENADDWDKISISPNES